MSEQKRTPPSIRFGTIVDLFIELRKRKWNDWTIDVIEDTTKDVISCNEYELTESYNLQFWKHRKGT